MYKQRVDKWLGHPTAGGLSSPVCTPLKHQERRTIKGWERPLKLSSPTAYHHRYSLSHVPRYHIRVMAIAERTQNTQMLELQPVIFKQIAHHVLPLKLTWRNASGLLLAIAGRWSRKTRWVLISTTEALQCLSKLH